MLYHRWDYHSISDDDDDDNNEDDDDDHDKCTVGVELLQFFKTETMLTTDDAQRCGNVMDDDPLKILIVADRSQDNVILG